MYRWTKPIPLQDNRNYSTISERVTNIRRVQQLPYPVAAGMFDEVCSWLESLGIQYHNTRVHKYKSLLTDLAISEVRKDYSFFEEKYGLVNGINAAHEAMELIRIYEGLRYEKDPKFIERLTKILQGHELFPLDKSSGRDFSLELGIAASFVAQGNQIDFSHVADLSLVFDGTPMFVECKRLKSESKIKANIKDGLKQLTKRYETLENPSKARGILVLSIGAVVNPNLILYEASDSGQLGRKVKTTVREFIATYKQYWERETTDKRSIAVIIIFDTPARMDKTLTTCRELDVRLLPDRMHSDAALFHKIAPLFGPPF
ncbi:hypothetical protein GCN78_25635 [Janthinobacterium rivuli]|uniref:hypothetical protein n=1 Tax=Janthinobacterium sp. FT68W TaxID=2654255 RepID=UPI0012651F3E|nr:hypothetical protein [Janthinobacterium sp. FT68W]KAB8046215.1 hypothetical protein GCN78_25635 [Janthinobacterium sp. FT68W]